MDGKRYREVNFSSEEEDLLVELVLNRKDVIEKKNSDTEMLETQTKAWEELVIEFNGRCPSNVVHYWLFVILKFMIQCKWQ